MTDMSPNDPRVGEQHSSDDTGDTRRHHRPRASRVVLWGLAVFACLWLSLCTAIGQLYRSQLSIAQFSWPNALYGTLAFICYMGIVLGLVRYARGLRVLPRVRRRGKSARESTRKPMRTQTHGGAGSGTDTRADTDTGAGTGAGTNTEAGAAADTDTDTGTDTSVPLRIVAADGGTRASAAIEAVTEPTTKPVPSKRRIRRRLAGLPGLASPWVVRGTNRWWKLAAVLLIGWLWVPVTLLSAFGADLRSQTREFSWAWNQWIGTPQPYIGFFSFVPMDIYPTAHYLWPSHPTYLTDQHNIVLTVVYGGVAAISRYFTDSNDAGFVALSAFQFLFAVFCCAATAHRFLNVPWVASMARGHAQGQRTRPAPRETTWRSPATAAPRIGILLFFLLCPLAVFSTISLTKSPLFAFAFVWWFGIGYELHETRAGEGEKTRPLRRHSLIAFALSTCVMLISVKYAFYILAVQLLIVLLMDRRRWRDYLIALLLPTIVLHGGLMLLISTGTIINGDPIESRGIQLQQIARVAKLNPSGIPRDARIKLSRVFNLDQMAEAYFQQDADPVKSSGIQSKKVSYRWRSVTKQDMSDFNSAWWQIVKANPVIATDAFLAKTYGYFDVSDPPYVSMDYYVDNDYVQSSSTWIKNWMHDWRSDCAEVARGWGGVPVLGWVTHGNLYVILTLLVGCAELVLRRWRTLAWHVPLLLLFGVMITAPANNFERHMLPVAFVFGFVLLTFWRESQRTRLKA